MRLAWWQSVEALLKRGERVFVCFVVEATKGSPGTPGAAIAVGSGREPIGTIGGGRMELDLLEEADLAIAEESTYAPQWETLHHHAVSTGRASGLICGGSQTHVSLVLKPECDEDVVASIIQGLVSQGEGVVQISSRGLNYQSDDQADAPRRQLFRDEENWSYRERLFNPRRIVILGGGHCGVALADLMRGLGYIVSVFETRADLFTFKQLPSGEGVVVQNFAQVSKKLLWPESTVAVVMTAAYLSDVEALMGVLPLPCPFIGLMGTRLKITRIREALTQRGFSATDLDRIIAPIGLSIDSDTPEEIAVSVAAQILLIRKELNLM